MIYESEMGMTVDGAMKEAVKLECQKFIHNNRIYEIHVIRKQVGTVEKYEETRPLERSINPNEQG